MEDRVAKAFDFAAELVKQLLTLATGLIAITVTFSKDVFATEGSHLSLWLLGSWVVLLISIGSGLMGLMALTGALDPMENSNAVPSINAPNARFFIGLQSALFGVGLVCVVVYAFAGSVSEAGSPKCGKERAALYACRERRHQSTLHDPNPIAGGRRTAPVKTKR